MLPILVATALAQDAVPFSHEHDVQGVAVSADGHVLASFGMYEDGVSLWDGTTHARTAFLAVPEHRPESLDLSPDGRSLVVGDDTGVQVWDVTTGTLRARLDNSDASDARVMAVVAAKDNTTAWAGWGTSAVQLDLATGTITHTCTTQVDGASEMAVSADGTRLAVSSYGVLPAVIDTSTCAVVVPPAEAEAAVFSLAFGAADHLATARSEEQVLLYDTRHHKPRKLKIDGGIAALVAGADPQHLVALGFEGQRYEIDLEKGRANGAPGRSHVGEAAATADGRWFVGFSGGGLWFGTPEEFGKGEP